MQLYDLKLTEVSRDPVFLISLRDGIDLRREIYPLQRKQLV
jgi:hypothetical protein